MIKSLAVFIAATMTSIYAAFVYSWFWTWFVVPLGVMEVGLLHMFGLLIIVSGLKFTFRPNEPQHSTEDLFKGLFVGLFVNTINFGLGYVVVSVM